jgi:signal peptidase I
VSRYGLLIEQLQAGKTISYREYGNSMTPLLKNGQKVTVAPVGDRRLAVGDIVLARVRGNHYLHNVIALQGDRVLIGNNHGHLNGWTTRSKVFGILAGVED